MDERRERRAIDLALNFPFHFRVRVAFRLVSTCASERDARTNEQRKSIARSSEDGKDTGGENGGGGDAVVKDEPREEDVDADADDAEGVVNVPRRARTGAWSRRVAFFSFDSRRVIFFQSARAVRAVVRASDGFPGARGWMVGLFHQPNQNRVESSCHPHQSPFAKLEFGSFRFASVDGETTRAPIARGD